MKNFPEKDATCTVDGYTAHTKCDRCDKTEGYEVIEALGHSITSYPQKDPTCTEGGHKAYETCDVCGYTTYTPIPMLGHAMTVVDAKEPTCLDIGWYEYKICSRNDCGHTENYVEISELGHDVISHDAKAPTCTDIGWEAYETCGRCDYTTYSEINSLGHDMSEWMDNTATCTDPGTETKYCGRCDYTESQYTEPLGHDYIYHDAKDKTCTEDGWYAYETCDRCDYTTKVVIPASHEMGEWYVSIPGNCTSGEERRDCSECDYFETRTPEHDLVYHEGKTPTCTETGYKSYETCTKCDYTTYEELPITHTYGDTTHTDATCSAPECDVRTCEICGHIEVVYGEDAKGHSYEDGKCTICGRDQNDYALPPQKFD